MNDGVTLLLRAEYAPVADPGFMKYFPSYYWTPNSWVCPCIKTSQSSLLWTAARDSMSPHGVI